MEPRVFLAILIFRNLKLGVVFIVQAGIIRSMKHGGKVGIRVLFGALLSASAMVLTSATAVENPYSSIVERNVFNLHPPPPPINPADLIKKTPPPKITFTGITTILGKKLALLTYPAPASKPNTPPISVMLAEGQAQDEIEVKSIDEKAQVVQIINHGEEQTLDFEHDAPKGSGPIPGSVPIPTPLPAPTAAPPPNGVQPYPGNVIRPLRGMQSRNSNIGNGGQGGGGAASLNVAENVKNDTMTPEEQMALIELQRNISINQGTEIQRLLPPTPATQGLNPQQPQPSGF